MENLETKKCPYCAEEINIEAIKCKHCGEFLNKKTNSNSRFERQDIISIVFGVLMIVFFFMPWFQWAFISVSGYEIPNYLINLDGMFSKDDGQNDIHKIFIYALFYSIPLFSFISAFLPLARKKTSAFSTLAGAVFLFLFYITLALCHLYDVDNIIGVGAYLSLLLSAVMVLYGLVRLVNSIRLSILQKRMRTSLKFSLIIFAIFVAVIILLIIDNQNNTNNQKHDAYSMALENDNDKYMEEIAAENKERVKESKKELKSFISKDKKGENFGDFIKKFGDDKSFQLSRVKFPIIVDGEQINIDDTVNYHPNEYIDYGEMLGCYLKKELTKDDWMHVDSKHFKPNASVNIDGNEYQCCFRIYSEHNVEFSIEATWPTCWTGIQYKFNKMEDKWCFVGF